MNSRTLSILMITVLALAVGVSAQTPAEPQSTTTGAAQTVNGRVISSSPTELVIEDETGTRRTYIVDNMSTVPTGLAAGNRVTVEFHPLDGGRFHAARVTTITTTTETVTKPAPTQALPRTETTTRTTETTSPGTTMTDTTTRATEPVDTPTTTTETETAGTTRRTRMPATASPLPLVGLLGLASLAGGAALRAFRRR